MHIIIQSSIHTLNKSKTLLTSLTDDVLSDHSVSPYYSCIGSHIRHIVDFYDCILSGLAEKKVDLIDRKRDEKMHRDCNYAMRHVDRVLQELTMINEQAINDVICVTDDLGLGKIDIPYTLGALFAQANSHAIHHYAIINYIVDRLGVSIEDDTFGYNPTTPKQDANLN